MINLKMSYTRIRQSTKINTTTIRFKKLIACYSIEFKYSSKFISRSRPIRLRNLYRMASTPLTDIFRSGEVSKQLNRPVVWYK